MEVLRWIPTLFLHWQNWLSGSGLGGFIVICTTVLESQTDIKISRKFKFLMFFCFFIVGASYGSWEDQRQEVRRKDVELVTKATEIKHLGEELSELRKPALHLSVVEFGSSGLTVYPAKGGPVQHGMGIVIVASLTNKGADSIADEWELGITLPDGRKLHPVLQVQNELPNTEVLDPNSGKVAKFGYADALYQMAAAKPIKRGEKLTGILFFRVVGVDLETLRKPGILYNLQCRDVDGTLVQTTGTTWKDEGRPLSFVPGMHLPKFKEAMPPAR